MRKSPLWNAALALLLTSAWAAAQTPEPRKLIEESMAYLAGLDALTVDINLSMHAEMNGETRENTAKCALALRGKKDLYLHIANDLNAVEIIANPDKQIFHFITDKEYSEEPPLRTRTQLIGMISGGAISMGAAFTGQYLHASDMVLKDIDEANYVGKESLDGDAGLIQYDHVQLRADNYDLDLWLAPPPSPTLRRFRMDLAKIIARQSQSSTPKSLLLEFDFANWRPNAPVAPERFTFTPPPDAKAMERGSNHKEQEPLIGKAAPNIMLDLLKGGKLDLASHKGKQIVILDFWATWCGPCRMALPELAKVASEYKDKGVVLYAVNQGESPERIESYLAQSKLDINVALDKDKRAGDAYGVSGIPRMVIIDKDGIVRAGHGGFSPTLREDIAAELDALLESAPPIQ